MSFDELERQMAVEDEDLRELGTPEEYEYRKNAEVFVKQAFQHRIHMDDKYETVSFDEFDRVLVKVLANSNPVSGRYIMQSNVVLEKDPTKVGMLIKFGLNTMRQKESIADNLLSIEDDQYLRSLDAETLLAIARSKTTNKGNVYYGIAFFQTDQDNKVILHPFCAIDSEPGQPGAKEEAKEAN